MANKPNGMILYEGPSMLDGKPIVVVATGIRRKSKNSKTGHLVQTWIMRSDISPLDALYTGQDESVCGDCKHRFMGDKTCYVNVAKAPLAVWRAYKRGVYPVATEEDWCLLFDLMVRKGSYGDPAAVPMWVWAVIDGRLPGIESVKRQPGYSHQWKRGIPGLEHHVMASVDSLEEAWKAQAMGMRTFRVMHKSESLAKGEILCPASKEAGHKAQCADCGLCDGKRFSTDKRANVAIYVHGPKQRRFKAHLSVVA